MSTTSKELFQQALQLIPGGVNSPVRSFKHVGIDPVYFSRGEGAYLYDVEGKPYIDFCASWGPHILGHSHPAVVTALQTQAALATSFGACHPQEVELARLLLQAYPFLDRVRLVNSGTEAVMTAIRIARGYTKRDKILKFEGCYHGHSDGLLAKAGSSVATLSESSSKGVPASIVGETIIAKFDDISAIEKIFKDHGPEIAAVILEPIPANHGLWIPLKAHLEEICMLAKLQNSLIIFDEVISGFRVGLSGACGYYDLKPDLVTLGKIIGGGLPLAAVAGTKAVMETLAPVGDVYQAGTLSGNPLATAAGIAVLKELFATQPYDELAKRTETFTEGLKGILSRWGAVQIPHVASLFFISFGEPSQSFPPEITKENHEKYAKLFKAALEAGIYFAPSPYEVGFVSTAHTPAILQTVLEKLDKTLK